MGKPERGSCLVFNHEITHDGSELVSGNKYILRTEVMYQHSVDQDVELSEEKRSITRFMQEIVQETCKYCFGVTQTMRALQMKALERLIIWDKLELRMFSVKDHRTNREQVIFLMPEEARDESLFRDAETGEVLTITYSALFVKWIVENA